MKLKRSAAVLAGLTAVTFILSGCSGSSGSSTGAGSGAGKTITVYIGVNTQYPQLQKKFQSQVTAAFKKQTGATVKWQDYASGNDELTKIQTSVVSGQGPDVYAIGTSFAPTAYATGAFVTLSDADWKAVGGKSRFVPASLGISGPSSSKQIAVPFQSRPYVLAYNTKMFQAAGLSKPAATWDGLVNQAKKLTGNGVYGMATDYKDNYDPWKFVWTFSRQLGNKLISGNKVNLNNSAVSQAYLDYFGFLTKDHIVDPASVGWQGPQALAAFASGKAAMLPMTSGNAISTLSTSPVKDDYKFAVMPTVPPGHSKLPSGGEPAVSILSGDNLIVPKYSPNHDLDFALIKYLTSVKVQEQQYNDFGNLPVTVTAAQKLETNKPSLQPLLDAGKQSYATPFSGAWGAVELAMQNVFTQAIPSLSQGSVSSSKLSSLLATAQQSGQAGLKQGK